jgi:hypothetical protein
VTNELRIFPTADLDLDMRSAIRELLYSVFVNTTDEAFGNALGRVHALLLDDGSELINNAQSADVASCGEYAPYGQGATADHGRVSSPSRHRLGPPAGGVVQAGQLAARFSQAAIQRCLAP